MKMRKQQGMSIVGFILLLGLVVFVAYLGMKIVPLYLEYHAVVTAMESVQDEYSTRRMTPAQVRSGVLDRLYLSYTANVRKEHVKVIQRQGLELRVSYEVRRPVIGNLDIVAHFDKSLPLR